MISWPQFKIRKMEPDTSKPVGSPPITSSLCFVWGRFCCILLALLRSMIWLSDTLPRAVRSMRVWFWGSVVSVFFFSSPPSFLVPCRSLVLKHAHKILLLKSALARGSRFHLCSKRIRGVTNWGEKRKEKRNSPTHQPSILRASHSTDGPLFFGCSIVSQAWNEPLLLPSLFALGFQA